MSLEENKAIVRHWFEQVRNKWNLDLIDELVAPNYVEHRRLGEVHFQGPEELKQMWVRAQTVVPDWHVTIEDMIAEGDKVAVRLSSSATHTFEWQGIPPTGKQVTGAGIDIFRIAGGKIVEHWYVSDTVGLLEQTGGVIRPAESGE